MCFYFFGIYRRFYYIAIFQYLLIKLFIIQQAFESQQPITRKLMDTFTQREMQEIEAAAQRKKKKKSVMHDNESDEF